MKFIFVVITLLVAKDVSIKAQSNDVHFSSAQEDSKEERLGSFNEGNLYESLFSLNDKVDSAVSTTPGGLRGAASNLSERNTLQEKTLPSDAGGSQVSNDAPPQILSSIAVPDVSRSLSSHPWERDYPTKVAGYETNNDKPNVQKKTAEKKVARGSQADLLNQFRSKQGPPRNMCGLKVPEDRPVVPTWLSSFPESGSKISWRLIEAVTLVFTGDILDSNKKVEQGVAVAIKTHYPSLERDIFHDKKFSGISRAILSIRNPVDALPALFRLAHHAEQDKVADSDGKGKDASVRAWLTWKSQNFQYQLDKWVSHMEWWLTNYSEENLHILPFEHVMSSEKGPDELMKLRDFLKVSDPTIVDTMTEPDRLACVWKMLIGVSKKDPKKVEEASKETRNLLYSKDAVERLIEAMQGVRDKSTSTHPKVVTLMDEYIKYIEENRKDKEEAGQSLDNPGEAAEDSTNESSEVAANASEKSAIKKEPGQEAALCTPLKPQEKQVHAAWVSSYPGSGSKIAWKLIESITGLYTGDDLDTNGNVGKGFAVGIKTHFPSYTKVEVFQDARFKNIRKAILQIRNPLHSILSLFRFIYNEKQKENGKAPVTQPPLHEWLKWRNDNFETELISWIRHTQWWLDNYGNEDLLMLPYEYITSTEKGSTELEKVGDFLKNVDPAVAESIIEKEKISCIWELIVGNYSKEKQTETQKLTIDKLYSSDPFSLAQSQLKQMKERNSLRPEFVTLMDEYLDEIAQYRMSEVNSII